MNTYNCKNCNKKFEATHDDVRDWGQYCSEECSKRIIYGGPLDEVEEKAYEFLMIARDRIRALAKEKT